MWWPLSNCCCRPRRAGTSIIYVRPAIRRVASFIRKWPVNLAYRPRCLPIAQTGAPEKLLMVFSDSPDGGQGKIVDGNRICNELGFEYQSPDPLVMPME